MGTETVAVVEAFHAAVNRHDVEAVGELITEDCVFESTTPPDGERSVGREEVLEAWDALLAPDSLAQFEIENMITTGSRAIVQWCYRWGPAPSDHVRGVDLITVRAGQVSESLAYVKG